MFDLITGREKHLPSHPAAPILLSTFARATLIAVITLIPVLLVSERLPEVPTTMAFVAALPAPPPPPPPPRCGHAETDAAKGGGYYGQQPVRRAA